MNTEEKEKRIKSLKHLQTTYESLMTDVNLELFRLLNQAPAVRQVVKVEPLESHPDINRVIHNCYYTHAGEKIDFVPGWYELKVGSLFIYNLGRVSIEDTNKTEDTVEAK